MFVDVETIQRARSVDLYGFLSSRYPHMFKKTSNNLYLKGNNSLVIHAGFHSYQDFATRETGNGIDFLMNYLHFSFQDAVRTLAVYANGTVSKCNDASSHLTEVKLPSRSIQLPEPSSLPHSRMYAYLMSRGIQKQMIERLASQGLIYQSANKNNIVFVNKERDYFELRGTYTFAEKAFHGCGKTRPDRFWYFKGGAVKPNTVFITEGAIDAISLFLIHKKSGIDTDFSVYASIGGVSNYAAIDRIKKHIHTILAVDNDQAGEICRARYSSLDAIVPTHKDWNEDLKSSLK